MYGRNIKAEPGRGARAEVFQQEVSFANEIASNILAFFFAQIQSDRFFDLWTLKEAYIKARGMGLSIPLDHFSFEFTPAGGITISFTSELDDQPKDWQFWQIQPSSTHRAAVGIKSSLSEPFYELHMRNAIPMMQMQAVDFPVFRKSANFVSQ